MTANEVNSRHRNFAIDFLRKASRAPNDSLTRKEFDQISQQQQRQRRMGQQRRNGQTGNTGGGRTWGPEIVPQMFSRFDANSDGYISREEAGRPGSLINVNFDKWDQATNQDGRLSREEVRARLTAEPASL